MIRSRDQVFSLSAFLGLRRNTVLILLTLILSGFGERLWFSFAPKYLEVLGASILIIGVFDAAQTIVGAVASYPGGWISDRIGQRKSLLLFGLFSICGYLVVLFWQHWMALIIGACLFLAWSGLALPTLFAVVATTLQPNKHTMGIGLQSLVRRVPMLIGPLAGGWIISSFGWRDGIQISLIICVVLSALSTVAQWLMLDPDSRAPSSSTPTRADDISFFEVVKSFTPTLRELLISDILIRFCERLPYVFVVLWAINNCAVTPAQFGILTAIEVGVAMICYVPVALLADRFGKRPFILATFIFFTAFPAILLFCRSFELLILAFIVRGLKEFGEPARKALILSQAKSETRARTYGAYYLIRDTIVTAGALVGACLWQVSPELNLTVACLFGLGGTLWYFFLVYGPARDQT